MAYKEKHISSNRIRKGVDEVERKGEIGSEKLWRKAVGCRCKLTIIIRVAVKIQVYSFIL